MTDSILCKTNLTVRISVTLVSSSGCYCPLIIKFRKYLLDEIIITGNAISGRTLMKESFFTKLNK
jgi:hypothetical protein